MRKQLNNIAIAIITLSLLMIPILVNAKAGEMVIVDKSKPAATIVISANVNEKVKLAAEELQTYIEKISGAKLSIVTDAEKPQGSLIMVGKSKLTDEMGVVIPSGMSNSMREEGFVIVCRGNRLVLAGNDAERTIGATSWNNVAEERANPKYHGTEYAVYDFLNRLGVRWFMPGEYGEIVPRKDTIKFKEMQISEKPVFIMRDWWGYVPKDIKADENRWKLRNKLNPSYMLEVPVDGSANLLVPQDKYFKDHPEYFAMKADGTRDPEMPNLNHPKAIEIAAETIKEYFRTHPEANCYGFSPYDGHPRDFNPEAVKQNSGFTSNGGRPNVPVDISTTDEWIIFVNKVTAEVRKEFPDHYIATNGYANRDLPPQGIKLDDHLVIMYASIMSCFMHSFDNDKCWMRTRDGQMFKRWCELSPNVWVYNYEPMLVSLRTPLPDARKVIKDFRLMKEWGSIGFWDESQNVWAEYSILGRYMRTQVGWNPDVNVDAIYDDFNEKWYGKAAKSMKAYYKNLEDAIENAPNHGHEERVLVGMYTHELLDKLAVNLAEAEKLADTDRDRLHIKADKWIYEHLRGYVGMLDAEAAGDFAGAIKWGDHMLAAKKELNAINPFYCAANEEGYESGAGYFCIKDRKAFFQSLADNMSGKTGDLVALLPDKAKFSTDPHEDGIHVGWYNTDFNDSKWKSILTTKQFYSQGYSDKHGHPYSGYMWYRIKVDVPASAKGKKVMLYAPCIEGEGWVWVNGKYVGRRPFEDTWLRPTVMDLDVTDAIKPGETNIIAIRGTTCFSPGQAPAGLVSRLFLYSPKVNSSEK